MTASTAIEPVGVRCLCWNCGKEITESEPVHEVNGELWCDACAASCFDSGAVRDDDEESV